MPSINHHVTGQQYWRSLEQLSESPQVAELLEQEFPGYDADSIANSSRRGFMKLMGAAMALAGISLTGCRRWPKEELAPYASNPRGITPGVPSEYASSWELGGVGIPLLVTSYDGRPIKIEGNPDHRASQTAKKTAADGSTRYTYGSADALSQAILLEMYDPDRSRSVVNRTDGHPRHTNWEDFLAAAKPLFVGLKSSQGAGLAVLSEASSSPSVAYQKKAFLTAFPKARWFEYEALSRDNERVGSMLAFGKINPDTGKFVGGRPLRPVYALDKASIIVSLDADILGNHPNRVRYANDWAQTRRKADEGNRGEKQMSRMFVAEGTLTTTGAVADARLAIDPARVYALAYGIAARLSPKKFAGVPVSQKSIVTGADTLDDREKAFVEAVVKALTEANGAGLVCVGASAPAEAHALAFAINGAIDAVGTTVSYIEDPDFERLTGGKFLDDPRTQAHTHLTDIAELSKAMKDGQVSTLLMIGGNPVYDAPADVAFADSLAKVATSIHLSLYDNETSRRSKWHLNRAHSLESWGDTLSWDGTITLQQPLIVPLFGGKTTAEVLALVLGDEVTEGLKIVRRTFAITDEASEGNFRAALERGFFIKERGVIPDATLTLPALDAPKAAEKASAGQMTLRFEADARVYDGRFANNGWLQETPDPITKLMWDNALAMSVKDARALGIDQGDKVKLTMPGGTTLDVPVVLLPGQPNGVVSLTLGYGRSASGPIGDDLGFNSYTLRTTAGFWSAAGVKVQKTGDSYLLVASTEHHLLSDLAREAQEYRVGEKNKTGKILREATLAEYNEHASDLGSSKRKFPLQLFKPPTADSISEGTFRDKHAWGMTIDLTACIGCNACALACQAENNIPIVGKDQCYRHREMNWIRIDRYFKGDPEDTEPEVVFQPMTCQHCENAPCEQVCPVAATVHDSEGLNTMVYNRCIGTRYCSNNCPYKVRRFNYFDFHAQNPRFGNAWIKMPWNNLPDLQQLDPKQIDPIKRMAFNPEVTVRMRGVMEKCTYCVQRIHSASIAHERDKKPMVDGDIVTACQQACPTEAIVFGDLMDPNSRVSKLQKSARAFDVLQEELNTLPRTRYLSKLRNPVA